MQNYAKPPIVEAVLEFRFQPELSKAQVSKAVKSFRGFPVKEEEVRIEAKMEIGARKVDVQERFAGFKLSLSDRTRIVIARTESIAFAELAPYSGWENFSQYAQSSWKAWRKTLGPQKLTRLGLKYINRIDIPVPPSEPVDAERYVTILPRVPDFGGVDALYTMQVRTSIPSHTLNVTINTSIVHSPVPNNTSILLDIDLDRQQDVPQRKKLLWTTMASMRIVKNAVFKACVKDAARELFGNASTD